MNVTTAGHIYLVDDDASIRIALTGTLIRQGYTVNAYASAFEFLEQAMPVTPAVILLDMRMPEQIGVDLQARLISRGWTTPIVFISGESQSDQIVLAMKQGALDFLLKPFSMEQLLKAIQSALEKDRTIHTILTKTLAVQRLYARLTPREREVFEEIVAGKTNKEIASQDGSAPATVKLHRARILTKLGVESLSDLLMLLQDVDMVKLKQDLEHTLT